ncbi:phosphoserine aminotransferase [Lacimicrobium alkaliphilum]|uniref:Phosphoserine aminotransferase n=2 Tax=Lacimicrobium alkaliphilum TaxID=1526571 RepID=A0ABQ1R1M9_9ALTE|nr:phosphoserine aminotransferase [Lacimicrobium alkaliphilum]
MEQAKEELLDWQGHGCSVMELSHRSKAFIEVAEQAEADLRDLLSIPEQYRVLFTHGGGRGQFSAVPMNLSKESASADYLVSGSWSSAALTEARKYLQVNQVAEATIVDGVKRMPDRGDWQCDPKAAYFHYCPNETVDGIAIEQIPDTGDVPLVADMSSTILSSPLDISRFGLIYAGAQKNIGPSGLSVVIVKDELLGQARKQTPSIFDYQLQASQGSMFNTPATFAWYLAGLVFKWLKAQGGVEEMQRRNADKSSLLYGCIDSSDFYLNAIHRDYRSKMNVPFQLHNPELDKAFLQQAEEAGLTALAGHRSVGGMRASIYNAMPVAGVQALVEFMQDFERKMG